MNLFTWVLLILAGHLFLYYSLGTPSWISTALLATVVWAAVLYGARYFFRQSRRERT